MLKNYILIFYLLPKNQKLVWEFIFLFDKNYKCLLVVSLRVFRVGVVPSQVIFIIDAFPKNLSLLMTNYCFLVRYNNFGKCDY